MQKFILLTSAMLSGTVLGAYLLKAYDMGSWFQAAVGVILFLAVNLIGRVIHDAIGDLREFRKRQKHQSISYRYRRNY